ncbi:MAG: hypothetical protein J6D26_02155 [Clostridia bacterium]|nr:hypothetical protein [Clostridia bacterium]
METKVILKYRRECDSWLCNECDMENSMLLTKCIVCGCGKSSTILRTWTEADEYLEKISDDMPVFKDDKDTSAKNGTNEGNILWAIIIILIIIGLIVAICQDNSSGIYATQVNALIKAGIEELCIM